MCTRIGKRTSTTFTILGGTPCCMDVEEIEAINPKISRKNGWEEFSMEELDGEYPGWIENIQHSQNGKIPKGPHPKTTGGQKIIWIDMAKGVRMHYPKDPVAEITLGKISIHFRDWWRVEVLRAFVSDKLRKKESHPNYVHFLRMIPTVFLLKKNRDKVIKKLEKLLEEKNAISEKYKLKRNLRDVYGI